LRAVQTLHAQEPSTRQSPHVDATAAQKALTQHTHVGPDGLITRGSPQRL
jgi:hypothetical protein